LPKNIYDALEVEAAEKKSTGRGKAEGMAESKYRYPQKALRKCSIRRKNTAFA